MENVKSMVSKIKELLPCQCRNLAICSVVTLLMAITTGQSQAITMYTDATIFQTDIGSMPATTLDFESSISGDLIPNGTSLAGITFNYDFAGLDMIVSSGFDTTSGSNYLGLDDCACETFLSGDSFNMTFGASIKALGLYIIGSPGDVWGGDFELSVANGSIFNADTPAMTLADGGDAFFLGIIDLDGFTSADLTSFDPDNLGLFEFNVDDITTAAATPVPEPGILLILPFGLSGLFFFRRYSAGREG